VWWLAVMLAGSPVGCLSVPASECDTEDCSDTGSSTTTDSSTGPGNTSTVTGSPTTASVSTTSSSDGTSTDGTGDIPQSVFRDDELDGEFGAGTMDGVEWANGRLRLMEGNTSGTFVSRVFDANALMTWQTLSWDPDAPYGKPLPDDAGAESGYPAGGIDMLTNILLLHLDGEGPFGDGVTIGDASGRGNDGTIVSSGGTSASVAGVFAAAMNDSFEAYVSIPTAGTQDFDFGTDNFSWSLWFQFDHACATNNVFMGIDDAANENTPHLWMGCSSFDGDCSGVPHPSGTFTSEHQNPDDGLGMCIDQDVGDGLWHHLAVTTEGHPSTTLRMYLDGQKGFEGTGDFFSSILMVNNSDFGVGGFSRGTYPSESYLDEVAIWRRKLEDDEVAELYRRGVAILRLQVRVCTQPDCSDDPDFVGGPTMQADDWFLDPATALSPGTELDLTGLPAGRYVQYRIEVSGAASVAGPALAAVTITAQ
jgi:hypothetical protein